MEFKKYKNISGRLLFFSEIDKKMSDDSNRLVKFSDVDIECCPMLAQMIEKGFIVEDNGSGEINIPDFPKMENYSELRTPENPFIGNESLAQPLGQPSDQVSLDPRGMSRLREYQSPPQEADLAVDPSKMSRYAETMRSLKSSNDQLSALNNAEVTNFVTSSTDHNSSINPSTLSFGGSKKESSSPGNEVWWCGPANDAGGYGKMNRECVEGLFKKGMKVELDLFKIPDFRCSVPITSSMNEMMNTKVSDDAPSVWAVMPQRFLPRAGKKIIYSMIETHTVQDRFLDKCKMADEIWLPSLSNMEAFGKADTGDIEIIYMPLGVDTELYKPLELTEEQRSIFNIKPRSFVFLCLCGWSLRKGVDVMLRAYLQQFTASDDVTLLIAARKDGSTNKENIDSIRNDIKKYINMYCPTPENPPHIIHIGDVMEEKTLPILYNMSNCFILPSRGEGFGLPYCEAGACEIPVIATRCGGQLDFLNDDNSFLVDIDGYSVGNQEIRCLSSYYEDAPFAVIGENGVNQMKEHMQFIVNNYGEAKVRAGKLRKNLEENFTWQHLVDRVHDRLKTM